MVFLAQEKMSSTSITADDKQNASEILGIAASVRKVNQIKAYRQKKKQHVCCYAELSVVGCEGDGKS